MDHSLEKYGIKNLQKIFDIKIEAKDEKEFVKKYSKKIYEKLDYIRSIYEDILNPDISDLMISYEIRGISIDLNKIWRYYKKIAKAVRMYEYSKILENLEDYINFLKYIDEIIVDLVNLAREVLEKKIAFWDKAIEYKKPKEYLG